MAGKNIARTVGVLSVAAAIVGLPTAPSGALTAHPIRYATPTGSGVLCTSKTPCSLATAINSAPTGADIVIESGTYGSEAAPLAVEFSDQASGGSLHIAGQSRSRPPVIFDNSGSFDFLLLNPHTVLSGITLITSGDGIASTGSVDHVTVDGKSGDVCIPAGAATFSESVCIATGINGRAIGIGGTGEPSETPRLRSVTAVASQPGGVALDSYANTDGQTMTVTVQNSILVGNAADLLGGTRDPGASVKVVLHNSDYRTVSTDTGSTALQIVGDATDITGVPKFVDPSKHDFTERSDSPTIDRGAASTDSTDLVGTPRSLGSAPDIGAFEFQPKPALGKLSVVKRSKTSVKVSIKVNPEDLLTSVKASAVHGTIARVSKSASAGRGFAPKVITLIVHGLQPKRKYTVKVTAKNKTGSTTSTTKSVTTR